MKQLQSADVTTWRVLVVDDEPDNLSVIQLTLEFFEIASVTAISGPEGLECLRTDPGINILLLDIQMPVMSGFELLQIIRSSPEWSALPAVAVTAHAMVGDRERVLNAGFDGYIPKPLDPEEFVELVRDILVHAETAAANVVVSFADREMPESEKAICVVADDITPSHSGDTRCGHERPDEVVFVAAVESTLESGVDQHDADSRQIGIVEAQRDILQSGDSQAALLPPVENAQRLSRYPLLGGYMPNDGYVKEK